ncbi:hypothetical protein FRC11_000390 [Ceratobasidium sp. 423]|nr:hypothetical protein FRC11_000390 [Ceratobasidium sp. 423]
MSIIDVDTTTAGTRTPPHDTSPPLAKKARTDAKSPKEPPKETSKKRHLRGGRGRGWGGGAKGKGRAEVDSDSSDESSEDKDAPAPKPNKGKGKAREEPELSVEDLARASIAPLPSPSHSRDCNRDISTSPSSSRHHNRNISTGPIGAPKAPIAAHSESDGTGTGDAYRATANDKKALIGFIFNPQTFDANNLNISDVAKKASTQLFGGQWSWHSIRDYLTIIKRKYACYERVMACSGTIHQTTMSSLHNRPEIRKQYDFDSSRTLEDEENEARASHNCGGY